MRPDFRGNSGLDLWFSAGGGGSGSGSGSGRALRSAANHYTIVFKRASDEHRKQAELDF